MRLYEDYIQIKNMNLQVININISRKETFNDQLRDKRFNSVPYFLFRKS